MSSDIERRFVEAFVTAPKRQRLLDFFASPKARWKALLELQHFNGDIIDARWAEPVTRAESTPESISQRLRQKGAPDDCYIFSNAPSLDRRSMLLADAIQAVHGVGCGTVISCIPGALAFFEGELFPDEHILHRTKT